MTPDILQFQDGERGTVLGRTSLQRLGLAWPAPDRLWLVSVVTAPEVVYFARIEEELALVADFFEDTGVELVVTPFVKVSQSSLPDDFDSPFVARGAMYLPEVES